MILVTGAAGKTGRAGTAALASRGVEVRALVHRPAQVEGVRAAGAVEAVVGDQRRADDVLAALAGCEAVYAIAPNMSPHERAMGEAVVEACARAGVRRLVYHSVIHPQLEAMPHHRDKLRVEERVVESGLDWTILRPNAYLQNLAGYVDAIVDEGEYRIPYGVDVAARMVDLADVAEVAVAVLTEDGHVHATYELSGPAPVTGRVVAEVASDVLGRPVRATSWPVEEWAAGPGANLDPGTRERLSAMFRHYDRHGVPGNPNVLAWLLGRPPRGLREVLPLLLRGGARPGPEEPWGP